MIFVSIGLAFIGFFLLLNRKFQKHPYWLISIVSLIESTLLFGNVDYSIFIIDSPYLWALSISPFHWIVNPSPNWSGYPNHHTLWKSMNVLFTSVKFQVLLFQVLCALCNCLIFYDLYIIMVNPFYSRRKR